MDTRPFTNTSPQGLSVNSAATNVSTHQTTNDTTSEHNRSKPTYVVHRASADPTHDAKTSQKRKFEEVGSDDTYGQLTESSKKTPKLDHARTTPPSEKEPNNEVIDSSPTPPLQQESNNQVTNSSPTLSLPQAPNDRINEAVDFSQIPPSEQETSDEDAEFSEEEEEEEEVVDFNLPRCSLAHRGRFAENSGNAEETFEPDHNATLIAIERMRNDVFTCNFRVQMEGSPESWIGWCGIPAAEMDKDVAHYFRNRRLLEDSFDIASVSMGTTFEDLSCINFSSPAQRVLGRERSTFRSYEGEQGQSVVASIETVSEAQNAHEKEAETRITVAFPRHIKAHRESMLAELWSPHGDQCFEDQPTHILAYAVEGDDQYIDLQFRVKGSDTAYWHFHGRMNKDLTNGRFHTVPNPVAKVESDLQFGKVWSDPTIDDEIEQRLQDVQVSS